MVKKVSKGFGWVQCDGKHFCLLITRVILVRCVEEKKVRVFWRFFSKKSSEFVNKTSITMMIKILLANPCHLNQLCGRNKSACVLTSRRTIYQQIRWSCGSQWGQRLCLLTHVILIRCVEETNLRVFWRSGKQYIIRRFFERCRWCIK